jgi:hypothetical protein
MLEFLFQFVLEVLGQIFFELAAELGWHSLKDSMRREREASPVLAAIGHFLMGVIAGGLSLLLFSTRLTERGPIPGVSLLASPLATGLAMHWIGEFWRDAGRERRALFTFRGGAVFAFGMALVRFLYFERAV